MVFKLVRIDAQEPSKVQLSTGIHAIGRGKFLHNDDSDKRVSRNHAELEVTNDYIKLKSLHQNPCFYIKKSTEDTQLLQLDCTVSLSHGDRFGLIPDHFWYEVLHCPNENSTEECPTVNGETTVLNKDGEEIQETEEKEQNGTISEVCPKVSEETIHFENSEEEGNLQDQNRSCSPSIMNNDQDSTEEYELKPQVPLNIAQSSPAKRSGSRETSPVDVKKVKREPDAAGDANNAAAGPSNGQVASSDSDSKNNIDTSPAKPTAPSRERCMYGANCYRRNPQHKAQFSHPADADWGTGPRGACPYGRACARADPRHWDTHDHPPGTQPPNPHARRPGQTQRRRQRQIKEESDSEEDSPARDLIVTGKRARKTVHRPDLGASESEKEEDPYGTDESDEWQPPSDLTSSQDFSQAF